jgi:hypothetical protein
MGTKLPPRGIAAAILLRSLGVVKDSSEKPVQKLLKIRAAASRQNFYISLSKIKNAILVF